jgi:cullin-associated NEDD8-dissociated protein 1
VAENLGRLFIYYALQMSGQIEASFKSASPFERSTVTKAFKFGASKETSIVELEPFVEHLVRMVGDADITVRRHALESLTAITHVQPICVKEDAPKMQNSANAMTKIDPSLIKEVDLGPFKHKVDDGMPIRKAAFGLLDTMIEKIPERVDATMLTEVVLRGLEDASEECMIQCLSIIHRLVGWSPLIVINQIDNLIESFAKQFTKNMANVATNDKAKNIMRSIIRVVEQLHRTPEIEGNAKFADFFREKIMDNPAAREMFQNIAATASQAVFSEHF